MRKDAALPNSVVVREVCPRDGFQNVKEFILTERKRIQVILPRK